MTTPPPARAREADPSDLLRLLDPSRPDDTDKFVEAVLDGEKPALSVEIDRDRARYQLLRAYLSYEDMPQDIRADVIRVFQEAEKA